MNYDAEKINEGTGNLYNAIIGLMKKSADHNLSTAENTAISTSTIAYLVSEYAYALTKMHPDVVPAFKQHLNEMFDKGVAEGIEEKLAKG
jgi:hypothetical protein